MNCSTRSFPVLHCLLKFAQTDIHWISDAIQPSHPLLPASPLALNLSSSHVWMWELDHKEGWAPKNWCFLTVVLEKTLESVLDSKDIKPVHPKGNQPWIVIGRTGTEAEAPILWPPDVKSWLIGKDPDAGKDWQQEEKRATEDEMAGWHHWFNGCQFEQT